MRAARAVLDAVPELTVDYLELRDAGLGPAPAHGSARLLVAARLGNTRLLDNIEMQIETPAGTAGPDGDRQYAQSPWRN
ncbi:pantoate--beta-alanine ligase [Mycobacterium avium subsp. avium 11-4751]|nr:pantoate--beta-alanine ligase [Mycobacterium avium subsp. avium 11-4751]